MSYLGNEQLKSSEIRKSTPVTASGGESTHSLGFTAPSAQAVMFYINGVKQNTDTYSVSGTTLTLSGGATLTAGDVVQAIGINDIGTSITVAPNSIGTNELAATGTPTSSKYLDGSMVWSTVPVADDSVTTIKIEDDAVTTAKILDNNVTLAKMAGLARGKIIVGDASGDPSALTVGAANQVLKSDGADVSWGADSGGLFASYAIIVDQKTTNVDGGTFTSGAWQTRDLQTEVSDVDGIVSISTNEFTLAAGSYLIMWGAPGYRVGNHRTRLYDVTGTAALQPGLSASCANSDIATVSNGSTRVTPSGSNTYRIEHRSDITRATDGFGYASNFSTPEIYTSVEIFKES